MTDYLHIFLIFSCWWLLVIFDKLIPLTMVQFFSFQSSPSQWLFDLTLSLPPFFFFSRSQVFLNHISIVSVTPSPGRWHWPLVREALFLLASFSLPFLLLRCCVFLSLPSIHVPRVALYPFRNLFIGDFPGLLCIYSAHSFFEKISVSVQWDVKNSRHHTGFYFDMESIIFFFFLPSFLWDHSFPYYSSSTLFFSLFSYASCAQL